MSKVLKIDEGRNPEIVGQLGAYLAAIQTTGARVADGFIVPLEQKLEDGASNDILRAFEQLGIDEVTLRASVNLPDRETEVIHRVKREYLLDAISYMQANAHRRGRMVAIIVQKEVNCEIIGTTYSINPVTFDKREIMIEADLWTDANVLNGVSEPDVVLLNKNTGALAEESNDETEICLTPKQISELYHTMRKVELAFDEPVSIGWGYEHGILYILDAHIIKNPRERKV
ncbi:hypothetical protein J6X09_02865 [Candidatus Saccharibacteria bacterium]|nr:hypothetical protein [Candidatus Saccharibacteria bacterium]